MTDINIPEEAYDRAWNEVASVRDASPRLPNDADTADVVHAALGAAAPLILAAWIDERADNYADAAEVFGKRAESLLSERPEGFQAMADRSVGKAIILDQEAVALRRRASVLRGEGQTHG